MSNQATASFSIEEQALRLISFKGSIVKSSIVATILASALTFTGCGGGGGSSGNGGNNGGGNNGGGYADISNANDFATALNANRSGKFKLTQDIDLSAQMWSPIGVGYNCSDAFEGELDGDGHTISGLWIEIPAAAAPVGLFGCLKGTVKNLKIVIKEDKSVTGGAYTGALAGQVDNRSTDEISNVHVVGTVKGAAGINGYDTGGIVGTLIGTSGRIIDSSFNGSVISAGEQTSGAVGGIVGKVGAHTGGIHNCSTQGIVNGNWTVGGIAGLVAIGSGITNNFSKATIAANGVETTRIAGGIVGKTTSATIAYNLFAGSVNSSGYVGGIAGQTSQSSLIQNNVVVATYLNAYAERIVGRISATPIQFLQIMVKAVLLTAVFPTRPKVA
jgi:hypothetical protein